MTIAKLKEAAEIADALTLGASFKIVLFLQNAGIVVRALDGQRVHSFIISWTQLEQSTLNPLLPAIKIVSEAFQAETSNAEG